LGASIVTLGPDDLILVTIHGVAIRATLPFTLVVNAVLIAFAFVVTRRLVVIGAMSRRQAATEALLAFLREQIRAITGRDPTPLVPFIGALFLFILASNLLGAIPGFLAPTASLSTTVALAFAVFLAVPVFGIRRLGLRAYLANYLRPTPWLLPLTLIGEFSRTLALAVRLFGNAMSGGVIAAILLLVTPLFVPVVMQLFGLVIGVIQAYIFAMLATVYVASGSERHEVRARAQEGGAS
jgi:F-type H+-transporting ATPase subunit a